METSRNALALHLPNLTAEIIANSHFIDGCVYVWADSLCFRSCVMAVRDCLLVERRTRDRKVASSNPGRSEAAGEFSSPDLTLCADSYSVFVPPRATAVARKRPQSFCQRCRWQVTPKQVHSLDPSKSEWDNNAVQV